MDRKTRKIAFYSLTGAAAVYGMYRAFKWYQSTLPDYSDELLLKISRETFKQIYPDLSRFQKINARNYRTFQKIRTQEERRGLMASIVKDKENFNAKLGLAIIFACGKYKAEPQKYARSIKMRIPKSPELAANEERLAKFIGSASSGDSLLLVDKPSRVLTAQEVKEIYFNSIQNSCNQLIDNAEKFIQSKLDDKKSWSVNELKDILEPLFTNQVNHFMETEISTIEGIKEEIDHHDFIFQASMLKVIRSNDEGIKLFLEQCDFTRKVVWGTLMDFKPSMIV